MWSYVAQSHGDKLVINISIVIYIAIILYSFSLSNATEFYILAAMVGFVQGGIQGSSRSLFAKLIPEEKAGEFFGIFNTFGKAGAFMGPALVAVFLAIFNNSIVMLLPILILFILFKLDLKSSALVSDHIFKFKSKIFEFSPSIN